MPTCLLSMIDYLGRRADDVAEIRVKLRHQFGPETLVDSQAVQYRPQVLRD